MPEPLRDPLDDLIARWPRDLPLSTVMWTTGQRAWAFLAMPRACYRFDGKTGRSEWVNPMTGDLLEPPIAFRSDPLIDLDAILTWSDALPDMAAQVRPGDAAPFAGGWIAMFAYGLGKLIEPKAGSSRQPRTIDPSAAWPLVEMHYCPSGFLVDLGAAKASWIGNHDEMPRLGPPRNLNGGTPAGLEGTSSEEDYIAAVERTIEYIRAGDIFQANIAHELTGLFGGSTRAALRILRAHARPWYGAYMELSPQPARRGGHSLRTLISMSPELFLDIEPSERGVCRITTRPMKGTRPPDADPEELCASEKDRAELNMIIDLMRNDLGRICRLDSVEVTCPRCIERHGDATRGILQATATISGLLRDDVDISGILRATFPPGSVTGAPKIRAMQIVDDLEPVSRGPYCGSVGWIGPRKSAAGHRRASFNVAIRTALIEGRCAPDRRDEVFEGTLSYSVGAGIVADSDPALEWQETLDKAAILGALDDPAYARIP